MSQIEKLIPAKMDESVALVLGSKEIQGFEKAYVVSSGVKRLKDLLTPEYMKPIMELQNNRLGFKTDKPDSGYTEAVVKNCLIEAVLMGVQPVGNQFNIIAGNAYITKEGFKYLLDNMEGLKYETIPLLPRINESKTSAAITVKIKWKASGSESWNERDIDIPIKMNERMGTDAVIGKATRKARAWLFNTISGTDFTDGDASDKNIVDISHKVVDKEEIELQRVKALLSDCKTVDDVQKIQDQCPEIDVTLFDVRKEEIKNNDKRKVE